MKSLCYSYTMLFLCLLFGTACRSKKQTETLQVFSAASLTEIMTVMANRFEVEQNVDLALNFASSGILARQIEMGAGAHVFLSANRDWVDYLIEEHKVLEENANEIAGNSLVLIRGAKLPDLELEMAIEQRFAMGDPATVPLGNYTRTALGYLHLWKDNHGFLYGLDARHVLKLVEIGEADYGIVYKTDALGSKKVKIIAELPPESYPPVNYYFCNMSVKPDKKAMAFLKFLRSDKGREIWEKFGFKTIH